MWPDTFEDWYGPLGVDRDSFLAGYDGEWTIAVAGALVAAGHDVHIVYGSREGAPPGRQEPSGATVHFVAAPAAYRSLVHATWGDRSCPALEAVWPWAGPLAAAASWRLVDTVRSLQPDAVVVQDYESLRFDVLTPLLRTAGLAVTGIDTGGSALPSRAPWKPVTRRLARRLLASHGREADRLRSLGHRRVDVWPVPVRTDIFRPADRAQARESLGIDPQEPVVFAAGRLHPVKQPVALSDACAMLGVTLVLAGEGRERSPLEARQSDGRRLRLLGQSAPGEIARWYAACDVVALASTQEGQPVAVLEALACGRGVVATAVGGVPEVIRDGETGWLVEARDPDALKAAIALALADHHEADRRGQRGRELVLARHTPAAFAAWMAAQLTET